MWLGIALHTDPGYVLIGIHHWTIETTLAVALPLFILFFLLLHALLLLLSWITKVPEKWSEWRINRQTKRAQIHTQQGLIEFSQGHWLRAKHYLMKALPASKTPLLNYLTAARAAQEMGDSTLRDEYLHCAERSIPDAKIAVELTQAELQLANQQWEQARITLHRLQDLSKSHPYVFKLLIELYKKTEDWPQLIALLPDLKRHQIIPKDTWASLQKEAYLKLMRQLIKKNDFQAVKILFQNIPKALIHDLELISEYCQVLISLHEDIEASHRLKSQLQKQFNESLILLYGTIANNKAQLDFAETLLKKFPNSAALYLSLGRISYSLQLWGKARAYFEKSIYYHPTPVAFKELGHLLEQLGEQNDACHAYRKGLELIDSRD
jgi:HemY protein